MAKLTTTDRVKLVNHAAACIAKYEAAAQAAAKFGYRACSDIASPRGFAVVNEYRAAKDLATVRDLCADLGLDLEAEFGAKWPLTKKPRG